MTENNFTDNAGVSSSLAQGLRPVPEVDEATVPLNQSFSSTQSASPPPSARPPAQSFYRREAYHRVPSDGAVDLSSFDGFSPGPQNRQSSMSSVGETNYFSPYDAGVDGRNQRRSISRVPVGSKMSSPGTPRSFHGLMDTPRIGPDSPDPGFPRKMETSPRKPGFFGGFFKSPSAPGTPPTSKPSPSKKWFSLPWGGPAAPEHHPLHNHGPQMRAHSHGDPKHEQARMETLERLNRGPSPDDNSNTNTNNHDDDDDDKPLHTRYSKYILIVPRT